MTPRWELHDLYVKNRQLFTDEVRVELAKAYPGLRFENSPVARDITDQALAQLISDIKFFISHPTLPPKYIAVRLDRFKGDPALLAQARRMCCCSAAIFTGPVGTGKSYLAAAIAVYWVSQGRQLCLPESGVEYVDSNQVWLVTNYEADGRFCELIRQVHQHRAILIATTSKVEPLPHEYISRRLKVLSEPFPAAPEERDLPLHPHSHAKISRVKQLFDQKSIITQAVIQQLRLSYPGLRIHDGQPDFCYLSSDKLNALYYELAFFIRFPGVPVEHMHSRLRTFKPRSEVQEELLTQITAFEKEETPKACFLSSPTGTGKTHLAVGLARRIFKQDMDKVFFITPCTANSFSDIKVEAGQYWIFDDCNFFTGHPADMIRLLQRVMSEIHLKGGKLLLTSCFSWDELLEYSELNSQPFDPSLVKALFE